MTSVPVGIVRAYHKMLPRLMAEETLDASTAVALGSGTLKDPDRVEGALMRAVRGGRKPPARLRDPAALAAMGIGVVSNG